MFFCLGGVRLYFEKCEGKSRRFLKRIAPLFSTGELLVFWPLPERITTPMLSPSAMFTDDTEENRKRAIEREWKQLCMLEMNIDHMSGKEAIELVKKETRNRQLKKL